MKFIDEFRTSEQIKTLSERIHKVSRKPVTLMEVCGGHTMAIHKFGLISLLPDHIRLLSGPGCPVCVSSQKFIDSAVSLAGREDLIITTYGDLIRVPGSFSSLEKEKGCGRDIRIVYSVMESLSIAEQNPNKQVVFLGIGFETTAPASAAAVKEARIKKFKNFTLLSAHKIMPPVMSAIVEEGVEINGFIAPGHVSAITGIGMYRDFPSHYGLGVVVSGFEPADILQSILMLVNQAEKGTPLLENEYKRVVKEQGNTVAMNLLHEVFQPVEDEWRGIGIIPGSGLGLCEEFSEFDASRKFSIPVLKSLEPHGCICGEILRGRKTPGDCPLFKKTCSPGNPVGACMVSSEGTCSTWFTYTNR
jgi:hydrogenase expression/formation protein HypD